jgi:predicted nucleic acid-binding protein
VIVFSNTTPIIALSSINQLDLLPRSFGRVHVVTAVIDECRVGGRIAVPDPLTLDWVEVVEITEPVHPGVLLELDKGEKHTLDMACKLKADWVLMDEKIGRNMAEYLGLRVIGTLGVLLSAKRKGWIPSFLDCVTEMREQGIYYHPGPIKKLAAGVGES